MIRKRINILLCILFVLILQVVPVSAGVDSRNDQQVNQSAISPKFTNILYFTNNFEISSNGKASVASCLAAHDCDSVAIQTSLQRLVNGSWNTIKTWSESTAGTSLVLSGTYYVAKSNFYRIVSTGSVYCNGVQVEMTTYTSGATYY